MGAYLASAAETLGVNYVLLDLKEAEAAHRLVRSYYWRFRARRPARMDRFAKKVLQTAEQFGPDIVITTGVRVPLLGSDIRRLQAQNIRVLNYSTDDPWNPVLASDWFLSTLNAYDVVFTPRRANMEDLRRACVREIQYLPFGYDPEVHKPAESTASTEPCDLLFVGGCDRERLPLIEALARSGLKLALFGGYWDRHATTRNHWRGIADQNTILAASGAARICLCLVRRANRDAHVMRSFEAAAVGGCILAEDTDDHRSLFGPDGAAYFGTNEELVGQAWRLNRSPEIRTRMAQALVERLAVRHDTYADRLSEMLKFAMGLGVTPDTPLMNRPLVLM